MLVWRRLLVSATGPKLSGLSGTGATSFPRPLPPLSRFGGGDAHLIGIFGHTGTTEFFHWFTFNRGLLSDPRLITTIIGLHTGAAV